MSVTRLLVLTWAALLLLLALTVAASFLLVGPPSLAAGIGIAAAKAALIFWVFMHLREDTGLLRVVAIAAFAWLGILFALGGLAYLG
ncbi:cytochrome C oxidase subunit IV family protein [Amaricoccus solimangrovi]|uniref:Caa(3)-type oxidase subunit IV n=1 Tax=Amaricoccus solimangrovi TaxID=2589815 RepID=A0A501WUJ0_9RHOB|nr:cytochrome C oxidase subunit IV family protein [Amaricoccus solimangrovi]TPE51047.1 caa(3)-type oxidase subunit IV [Amaricoccus solimangrovi]